jgi:serine/threonine protein kinase
MAGKDKNPKSKSSPQDQTLDDQMADRFWKLKQTDGGKTFSSESARAPGDGDAAYTPIDVLQNAIIGGTYCIIKSIGHGGMGEVYLAKHLTLDKTCALKLIPPNQVTDTIWQRFRNEARTIASLDHINLVKVTDLGIHEDCLPYYAMEYIEGETLAEMLKDSKGLPLPVVLDIFTQVCDGVDYAHKKGVVHRDLKPGNIMLAKSKDGKYAVKILDFGLVKLIRDDRHQQSLTKVGQVFGTPFYMSPEQCMSGKIDSRSDIYSLGCTMFESLTGRPPFMTPSPVDTVVCHINTDPPSLESIVGPNIYPASLESVLARLLRKKPGERYQTLLELRSDLEKVGRGEKVEPTYVSTGKPSVIDGEAPTSMTTTMTLPSGLPKSVLGIPKTIISATLCTMVLGLATIAYMATRLPPFKSSVQPPPRIDSIAATPQKEKPSASEVPPASLKDTAPFSSIVERNGIKWRVFNFPEDTKIGCIKIDKGTSVEARGKVTVQLGTRAYFVPFPAVLKYPGYLKRFREGDIYEIMPESPANLTSKDYPGSDVCLQTVAAIPGVQALNLNSCDDLTNKSLATLEKYPALIQLYLIDNNIDAKTLAGLSTLRQLSYLSLQGYEALTPLLAKLQHSTQMQTMLMQHSQLNLQEIAYLSTLPNLEHLVFKQVEPSNAETSTKALMLFSKNKKLKYLSIAKLPVGPDTIEAIKPLKNLEALALDPQPSALNYAAKRALFRELPDLLITDLQHRNLRTVR